MADFDMDAYLRRRPFNPNGTDRLVELEAATQAKVKALSQLSAQRQAQEAERQKSLNDSVVGMSGLDPDSVIGTAVNTAVRGGAALSKASGMVGSGVWDLIGAAANQHMPDEVKAARKRQIDGTATPADLELLSLPAGDLTKKNYPKTADYETNAERIQRMERAFSNAKDVRNFFDLSNRVYQGDTQRLQDEIKDSSQLDVQKAADGIQQVKDGQYFDGIANVASGVKGSIGNAITAGMNNPKAVVETLIDQAPNIVTAMAGAIPGAIYNTLYGLNTFGEGIQEKIKKGKGKMPSDAEMADSAKYAALASAAEVVGDKAMGITGILKGAKNVTKAGTDVVEEVTRKTLKDKLFGLPGAINDSAVAKVAKTTAKGGIGEYGTEGSQTWLEEAAKGNEATLEQMNVGASMGLLTGAPMSGASHTVNELGNAATKAVASAAQRAQEMQAKQEARKNPDVLLDPKSSTYDPAEGAIGLYQKATSETATEEDKASSIAKIAKTSENLKFERDKAFSMTQEGVDHAKEQISQLTEESKKADPELASLYGEMIAQHQGTVDAFAGLSEQDKAAAKTKVAAIDKQLSTVTKLQNDLILKADKNLDVDGAVAQANIDMAKADETIKAQATQSAAAVINLSMRNPGRVSANHARTLAQNQANGLDQSQRDYLMTHAAYQDAVEARKKMPKVHMEVIDGDPSKNQLGLVQYRQMVESALRGDNAQAANKALTMLRSFQSHHQQKFALLKQVYAQVQGTNKDIYIQPTKGQGWGLSPNQNMSEAERNASGALKIHRNSGILIKMMEKELAAMDASVKGLSLARDMHFNTVQASPVSSTVLPEVTQETKSKAPVEKATQSTVSTQSTIVQTQSNVDTNVDSKTQSTQATEPAQETEAKKIKNPARNPSERDDLVGAILRVTGGQGISTKFLLNMIGDDLKHAGRAKKAFASDGQEVLGELAQYLMEEEDYGDGTVDTL